MSVVAITGNLGAGKTTVAELLKANGAHIFDCDEAVHRYYRGNDNLVFKKISYLFPEAIRKGVVSRSILARIVFADIVLLKKLEAIIHPAVLVDLKCWIENIHRNRKIGAAQVPLLFEKKLQNLFDYTILVRAPMKQIYARIKTRDGMSKSMIKRRLSFYCPMKDKIKAADIVIHNNADRRKLKKSVDIVWNIICSLKEKPN